MGALDLANDSLSFANKKMLQRLEDVFTGLDPGPQVAINEES